MLPLSAGIPAAQGGVTSMTAREDILAHRYMDTPAARTARAAAGAGTVADLFASFVGYASVNWDYAASPRTQTARDLLDGDGIRKQAACGTLRDALKLMLREDLQETVSDAIQHRFLTRPDLNCFDSKVKGNVGYLKSSVFNLGCYFPEHYFLQIGQTYYDPCLMAVYPTDKGPAACFGRNVGELIQLGTGKDIRFLRRLKGKTLPGFESVYELLAPHQCKDALPPLVFETLKKDAQVAAAKLF
jgi:hypothetical protein